MKEGEEDGEVQEDTNEESSVVEDSHDVGRHRSLSEDAEQTSVPNFVIATFSY